MTKVEDKNKRIQNTLRRIRAAFQQLVVAKNFDELTVSDLCREAGIGRKTFYAHYSSLDDLMEQTLVGMTEDYIKRIKDLLVPDEVGEITRQFYIYSEEQGLFYEKLVCSDSYQKIGGKLLKKFVYGTWRSSRLFCELSPTKQELLLCFIYSAGAGLYRQWVENGRKMPIDEMIEFANNLLAKGISWLADAKNS